MKRKKHNVTIHNSGRSLLDIRPLSFAEELVEEMAGRLAADAELCAFELRPFIEVTLMEVGKTESKLRNSAHLLASYARSGIAPTQGIGLVHDAIKDLASLDHLQLPLERHPWDGQPDDPETLADTAPDHLSPTARDAHLVLLAALCRLSLRPNGGLHGGGPHPVPAARLAAAGGVTAAAVRLLVSRGKLRRWRRGVTDQRLYIHPEDAKEWLDRRSLRRGDLA